MTERHIDDRERRTRLARRHGIAPRHRHPTVAAATHSMTALHATEAPSVYLSLAARIDGITADDIDCALYQDRSLVRQLAMRRTMFTLPRDLLPAVWGSAAARAAHAVRRPLFKDVLAAGISDDADAWFDAARAAVRARLADGSERSTTELREQVPELAGRIVVAPGKRYGGEFPVAPRVLTALGAEAVIVRATNAGGWWLARQRWTLIEHWLGAPAAAMGSTEGYAELVRRWLWTFGPGTETDLVWWLGATKTIVCRALSDASAVAVTLDGGGTGWVLSDDVDPVEAVEPWAALLPVLDPTTMGWKERDFYLDPANMPYLFDSNGNGGTTAWWDGRIVGCWVQDDRGGVEVILREDPGAEARAALEREADRLTAWLGGVQPSTVYRSALMKGHRLP